MRKIFIVFLITVIVVLASFLYKNSKSSIYKNVPLVDCDTPGEEGLFFLYIFLSKQNCHDCLKVIDVLNQLQSPFKVVGVVPENELKDEKELRIITGAQFPLISNKKYRKYKPRYSPSILGISANGQIYFVIPGVPGMEKYLDHILRAFYKKIFFHLD